MQYRSNTRPFSPRPSVISAIQLCSSYPEFSICRRFIWVTIINTQGRWLSPASFFFPCSLIFFFFLLDFKVNCMEMYRKGTVGGKGSSFIWQHTRQKEQSPTSTQHCVECVRGLSLLIFEGMWVTPLSRYCGLLRVCYLWRWESGAEPDLLEE